MGFQQALEKIRNETKKQLDYMGFDYAWYKEEPKENIRLFYNDRLVNDFTFQQSKSVITSEEEYLNEKHMFLARVCDWAQNYYLSQYLTPTQNNDKGKML